MDAYGLWRGTAPLILASRSAARQALLTAAAIPFESVASALDERSIEAPLRAQGAGAADIAAHLARAKAEAVATLRPGRLVLGADQTLSFNGTILTKPATYAEARRQLADFSGRIHELHSALCVMRDADVLFETVVPARLTCRSFGGDFIDHYIAAVGNSVLESVGAYQIEALGIHLFEKIDGDEATIRGLPLLPLLAFLRREGSLVG